MVAMGDFKKLSVWQRSHELVLSVYRATAGFPSAEVFGLVSQLRRAAISISANVAESSGRSGNRDQARFLQIAKGSAKEVESLLLIARDLGFLSIADYALMAGQVVEVQRMLSSMLRNCHQLSPEL
jgi:four helix bundle protein